MNVVMHPTAGRLERDDHRAGFAFLAELGKTVLRPGGIDLTRRLLHDLAIGPADDVVEIAPGPGRTAQLVLAHFPATYVAVDRDRACGEALRPLLHGPTRQFVRGSMSRTGLPSAGYDVAIGEAFLTMQPSSVKDAAVAELARLVRPGGRLGIHEVAFRLADVDRAGDSRAIEEERICHELTSHFKVAFGALTLDEWDALLSRHGFAITNVHRAPLRLLEPDRLIADEGYLGAARFAVNVARNPATRRRIAAMRQAMLRNAPHLQAVALTARRVEGASPGC